MSRRDRAAPDPTEPLASESLQMISLRRLPSALTTVLALSLLGGSAAPALAQAATLDQAPAGVESRIDGIFAQWDSQASAGCAVGVTQNGQTVFEGAYGMADLEHGIENTPETIFEGGSVSKQFTAAAIVLLVLDGKLDLDDDVRDYVPELPDYGHTITLHHLMTHTSGLRDWGSVASISGWGREQRSHDHDDVVDILSRQSELNFEPGHEYSYSNSGYNLLAVVVDRVSGMSFADFSTSRIFEPLGMTRTQWRDDYRRIVPGRSSAYNRTTDGWEINRPIEYVHGNGGILSTVGDLGIWNEALTDGRLGGQEFVRLMHLQGTLNDGSEIVYAGGLQVSTLGSVSSVTHTGSTAGYRAYLGRFPEQRLSVAMLCNASNVPTGGNGARIARALLGDPAMDPEAPSYALESVGYDLEPFVGLYREPVAGTPLRLTLSDGVLRSGSTPLLPLSGSEFQVGSGERRYVFDRSGSRVTGFRVEDWQYTDRRFDRVEDWTPTAGELTAFEGWFASEDAETTFRVTATEGGLELWQRPNDTLTVQPIYPDAFRDGGRIVRFRRDGSGRVVELSLSIGRVYDITFTRAEGSTP
jgi:CubicO group peptidase (beta-lactamase class C family)